MRECNEYMYANMDGKIKRLKKVKDHIYKIYNKRCKYCKREIEQGSVCDSPICCAKEELNCYRYKQREADDAEEAAEEALARATACGNASTESTGCSANRQVDTFEKKQIKYMEFKAIYEDMRLKAMQTALDIEYKIRCLDSPYSEILRLKYIKLWTFEKIAVEMNYEYSWLQRLHRKAIRLYSELAV